jgi:hypothetical protein
MAAEDPVDMYQLTVVGDLIGRHLLMVALARINL